MKILDRINSWIRTKSSRIWAAAVALAAPVFLFLPKMALAANGDTGEALLNFSTKWIINIISWLVYYLLIYANGALNQVLIKALLAITSYSGGFTNLPAIENAWEVVLDLTNMLFIVFLLIIAFATVFKMEAYSYKKLLPILIIVAILVNFSKVICGLLIDASQIVMLTFADAIKDTALANLTVAFQIDQLFGFNEWRLDEAMDQDPQPQYLVATLAAGAMMSVMVITLFVYLIVFLGRIAIFWIATVLSPLAFVCAILPATKKYYQQWAETFARYLIVGPLAMFFLWLALYIVASTYGSGGIVQSLEQNAGIEELTADTSNPFLSNAMSASVIANFIIATLLLMKGMELAQSMASEFGSFVGKAKGIGEWFAKGGLGREIFQRAIKPAVGYIGKGAGKLAKGAGKSIGFLGEQVIDTTYANTGVDLNLKRVWEGIKSERSDIKRERELLGRAEAKKIVESGSPFAIMAAPGRWYRDYLPLFGEQQKGALRMGAQLDRWRKTHPEFLKLDKAYDNKKSAWQELQNKKYDEMAKFQEKNITKQQENMMKGIVGDIGKLQDSVAGDSVNRKDAFTQSSLNDFMSMLESENKMSEANQVRNILNGTSDMSDSANSNIKSGFGNFLASKRTHLEDALANVEKVHGTDKELEDAFKMEHGALFTDINNTEKDMKEMRKQLGDMAPALDYGGVQAQRSYMAEELKKLDTDNENDLKSMLRSRLRAGDQTGVMATVVQSAKVGHMNEMMDEFGYEQSAEGMREFFDDLITGSKEVTTPDGTKVKGLGVDEELALSVADDASRAAKAIGHWEFSEMVTVENGRHKWRSPEEKEMRQYNEMTKAGTGRILRDNNRLALGYHTKDGGWKFSNPGLASVAKSLGRGMNDSLRKNMINSNWVEQMQSNPEEVEKLRKAMEEEARKRPEQEAEIRESFRRLLTYTSKSGTSGFDPAQVVAEQKRISKSII